MSINNSNFVNITAHVDDNLLINPVISFRWYPYAINYKYFQVDNYFSELDTDEKLKKARAKLGIIADSEKFEKQINKLVNLNKSILEKSSLFDSFKIIPKNNAVDIEYKNLNADTFSTINIPQATTQKAGVMSVNDKVDLTNSTVKKITWNNSSNINNLVTSGVYHISGERLNINDNLPILNSNPGHTIDARLTILNSSISGTGDVDDKCITQVLSFSNRLGQGEIYIRTGKGSSLNNLTWEKWSTLLRNVNVGEVESLDALIDNGVYSGVWTKGSYNSYPLTFVCIVINDYFIGKEPRRIAQFVYGLSKFDGSIVYKNRLWDDNKNLWSDWENINNTNANVQAVDINETLDDVETNTYLKYVTQMLSEDLKKLVRLNIGIYDNYYNKEEIDEKISEIDKFNTGFTWNEVN